MTGNNTSNNDTTAEEVQDILALRRVEWNWVEQRLGYVQTCSLVVRTLIILFF